MTSSIFDKDHGEISKIVETDVNGIARLHLISHADDKITTYSRGFFSGVLETEFTEQLVNGVDGIIGMEGPTDLAISSAGDYVYVTSQNGAVSVFERNAPREAAQFVQAVRQDAGGFSGLEAPVSVRPLGESAIVATAGNSRTKATLVSLDAIPIVGGTLAATTAFNEQNFSNVTIGQSSTDAFNTLVILDEPFPDEPGRLTSFSYYLSPLSNSDVPSEVTPLLFEKSGDDWKIVGIGQAVLAGGTNLFNIPFNLVDGSGQTSGRYFGFYVSVPFELPQANVTYTGSTIEQAIVFTDPVTLAVDEILTGGSIEARDYAMQATTLQRVRTGAVVVEFENIESLGVATGGGSGVLTLADATGTSVTTTNINTGDGGDEVQLFDLSATTSIDLGSGHDRVQIHTTSSGTLVVNGGAGNDFFNLVDVGEGATVTLNGQNDSDFFRVEGDNIESGNSTTIVGGDPTTANPGDELLYDPNSKAVTESGDPASGSVSITDRGTVNYSQLENVQIEGAPVITHIPAEPSIAEGDTLNLSVNVDFAGQSQVGEIEWDLDNDGIFSEPEELPGTSQSLTWEELFVAAGIRDDGLYRIAVRATNSVATTTRYRTLAVDNTPPAIAQPTLVEAGTGAPFTIPLLATDPGDDAPTRWEVSWGDAFPPDTFEVFGASATEATHVYTDDGEYIVTVRVYDEDSGDAPASSTSFTVRSIVREIPNNGPFSINEGQDLTLSASPYGSPTSISWDLNADGIPDLTSATGNLSWSELEGLSPNPIDDNGEYLLLLKATYPDGADFYEIDTLINLSVNNVAPTASISSSGPVLEGSDGSSVSVSLVNPIDPSSADSATGFTYDFYFGDSSSQLDLTTPTVNVPTDLLVEDGTLLVRAVIKDKDGGASEYTTSIEIQEDVPEIQLTTTPLNLTSVAEGQTLQLDVGVTDQGNETLSFIQVDWGDGIVEKVSDLSQPLFHVYQDNGLRTIHVSFVSDGISYSATTDVNVTNADPAVSSFQAQTETIYEGDTVFLSGLIHEPGGDDSLVLEVNWGDNLSKPFLIPAGSDSFEVTHSYVNDGTYNVTAILRDDDGGVSQEVATTIVVANAAPEVVLTLNQTSILESSELVLNGVILDAGVNDVFDVIIDWGDASSMVLEDISGGFQAIHLFRDDLPTATSIDDLNISVTVIDTADAMSQGTANATVQVENVAPQLNEIDGAAPRDPFESFLIGQLVTIGGVFTEQGIDDEVTLEVDWGDGNVTSGDLTYTSNVGGDLLATHQYDRAGDFSVRVRLLDDDGGVSNELISEVKVISPQVESIQYGDDLKQRSVIREIAVQFNTLVAVDDGAFVLTTKDGAPIDVAFVLSEVDGKTRALLTFSGSEVDSTGSLKDGNYILTILATYVRDQQGNAFDGDGDGIAGGDAVDEFFRFYGDANGDRMVDNIDLFGFRRTYRKTNNDLFFDESFDVDGDGDVDNIDLFLFRRNYRKSLAP
ncbi:MAG: PKD domain-containing protein [bacterium]|nr:PKD domain-containing protein [bacterium]